METDITYAMWIIAGACFLGWCWTTYVFLREGDGPYGYTFIGVGMVGLFCLTAMMPLMEVTFRGAHPPDWLLALLGVMLVVTVWALLNPSRLADWQPPWRRLRNQTQANPTQRM